MAATPSSVRPASLPLALPQFDLPKLTHLVLFSLPADFSTPIFEEYLGQSRNMALILGSVLATVYALSACISFPLVDKVGRRKLYFIGTIGQALSMFLIMACLIPGKDSNAVNGAVVGSVPPLGPLRSRPSQTDSLASPRSIFLFLTFFGFTWLECVPSLARRACTRNSSS